MSTTKCSLFQSSAVTTTKKVVGISQELRRQKQKRRRRGNDFRCVARGDDEDDAELRRSTSEFASSSNSSAEDSLAGLEKLIPSIKNENKKKKGKNSSKSIDETKTNEQKTIAVNASDESERNPEAKGVTKFWSPFFSPLSTVYNVPTEEPTAAKRLAILHLLLFACDFVAVKTGANRSGGYFFDNFAMFADSVKDLNEWWRLPSSSLADFGLEHVLVTNVSLWLIGREIETLIGTTSFLAIYFLGGTSGAISTIFLDDASKVIAGSSGALFALYGAILTYTALNLESDWNRRGFTTRLLRIGASSTFLCYIGSKPASDGLTHVVNNFDHAGGFLSGIVLAYYGLCPVFSSIQYKRGQDRKQRLNLEDKTLEQPFGKASAILYGVCANLVFASAVVAFKRFGGIDDF